MHFVLEHTMLASFVQSRLFDDPNSETRVGPRGRANIIAALSVFSISQWHRPDNRYGQLIDLLSEHLL